MRVTVLKIVMTHFLVKANIPAVTKSLRMRGPRHGSTVPIGWRRSTPTEVPESREGLPHG
jgi:hypothetical protein